MRPEEDSAMKRLGKWVLTGLTWLLYAVIVMAGCAYGARDAQAAPPQPDPHPSACKKQRAAKKPCRASVTKRAYAYKIVWRVEVDPGDGTAPYVTFMPGECTVPVRGPETCSITISWGSG